MDDSKKSLCVVFDIDETLIHFIQNKHRGVWDDNPDLHKEFTAVDDGKHIIILRPYLDQIFQFFKSQPQIKVGLWTYSEQEYSEKIANLLIEQFQLPEDFFYLHGELNKLTRKVNPKI